MKFKVGDRVTNSNGHIGTVISNYHPLHPNRIDVHFDNNRTEFFVHEFDLNYEIPQCPVIVNTWVQGGSSYQAMGYGATPTVKVSIGTKVVMKPIANPNDVGSEFAGSVGTIIDVPTLFSEHYEIEMGPAHNFQHVYANDHQFSVCQDYEDFVTPVHQQRKKEGLCPTCGEKGHFSNFAFVCTKHGEY